MSMEHKPYRRGSSVFRVRTPSLSSMESSDLEERFLTFLDHPQNHKRMKNTCDQIISIINMISIFCVMLFISNERMTRRNGIKSVGSCYITIFLVKNNNRKPPAHEISISDELIKSVSDNVWQYRGGKIEIPTYIFDEPYDVVSGLLARRIFGLYTEHMQQRKKWPECLSKRLWTKNMRLKRTGLR